MNRSGTFSSIYKSLIAFLYIPWFIDLFISLGSFILFFVIIYVTFANRQTADVGELILTFLTFLYSTASTLTKKNNDRIELDSFKTEATKTFENFHNVIQSRHPEFEKLTYEAEQKVLKTYFDDWKKHKDIAPFEYQLMKSYLDYVATHGQLDDSEKLFLKYRIVTTSMTVQFPLLVSEIENGDYFTAGTAYNKFIKKVFLLANQSNIDTVDNLELEDEEIQDTLNFTLQKSNPVMEKLLMEKKSREKIEYLLGKCYENAYSNIGNLDRDLHDDAERNLTVLFKYDERFSIPKRQWHTGIRKHLSEKYAKENKLDEEHKNELDDECKKEENFLKQLLSPQPFSKAIQDFGYCIERLADRDHFLYAVYPERFGANAKGWTVEKFMKQMVIPRAKQYLDVFNKKLIRKYPYLKKYQKRTIDANYYIFHFNRRDFEYHADQDSMPIAIKRFLVKSILESENAADHLASQLVYVKQVIRNITISGLLFTETLEIQKGIQGREGEIIKESRKNNLIISNVHEIASIGNQIDLFAKIIYEVYYGKKLKRKSGKTYSFAQRTAAKIVENAKEILQVFEALKTSSAT
jgi:hypothetical protein